MTRRVVATEGKEFKPGVFLEPGCLQFREAIVPIVMSLETRSIGSARDFERNEETGEISFDFELWEEMDLELYETSAYCTNLIERREGNMRIILEAIIKGVILLPIEAIPKSFSQKTQAT